MKRDLKPSNLPPRSRLTVRQRGRAIALDLARVLNLAPREQLALPLPAAKSRPAIARQAPCTHCRRRGYHLAACPYGKPRRKR